MDFLGVNFVFITICSWTPFISSDGSVGSKILYKACNHDYTYTTMFGSSLEVCKKKCNFRSRCKMSMYHARMKQCSFLGIEIDGNQLFDTYETCFYVKSQDDSRGCDIDETYDERTRSCLKVECPNPPKITNTTLLSTSLAFGSTNRYRCSFAIAGVGNASIRCQNNATWTSTDFSCTQQCSKPLTQLHAKLVDEHEFSAFLPGGTTLHYICDPGYHGNGENINVTCAEEGIWSPHVVPCCMDGTSFLRNGCLQFFKKGTTVATNFTEMEQLCKDLNKSMASANKKIYDIFNSSTGVDWLIHNDRKSKLHSTLLEGCLAYHVNASMLELYTQKTYDETLSLVKTQGKIWTSPECNKHIKFWHVGQPDGAAGEDCIILGPHSNFKFNDTDCSFLTLDDYGFGCKYKLPAL